MTQGSPTVVVGGSVAALVAADALGASGRPVELLLPERGVGGGFLPHQHAGRRLDLGPRVLELRYDTASAPVPAWSSYVAGPHGHRPFLAAIEAFVAALVGDDLVEVGRAQVSVNRRRCSDYVLAGDLSGIVDVLDDEVLDAAAAQAMARVEAEGPHGIYARGSGTLPWDRTFGDVARAQTGALFHELLIEPIAAKILDGGSEAVVAALHRKIWLPLFHPTTAWEACRGALTYRPDRPFATVAGGGMGEVVRRLVARILDRPTVTVREEGALTRISTDRSRTRLELASGLANTCSEPIIGVSAEEVLAAVAIPYRPDRVLATMVWVDVPASDIIDLPSILFATEPDIGLLRVTESLADERPGRRTVCCEVAWTVEEQDRIDVTMTGLVALGVVRDARRCEVVANASRPAFATPSPANHRRFTEARRRLHDLHLPIALVGGIQAFGADSFNEQVAQGLAEAARRVG